MRIFSSRGRGCALHDVAVGAVDAECHRRRAVHDDVHPQDGDGRERLAAGDAERGRQQEQHGEAERGAELEAHELDDVGVDRCGPRPTAETMVAKLSSVSTIVAASFETSVPVMPMAMPMSAFFSAGASFTPSPVIATTLPRPLQGGDEAQLVLGCDTGEHRDVVDAVGELVVVHPVEVGAGDRLAARGPSCAPMAAAVAAWSPVIIFTVDAGAVGVGDRVAGLGPRRVDDAGQRQQGEVVDERRSGRCRWPRTRPRRRRRELAMRDGQHAQTLRAEAFVVRDERVAVRRDGGQCAVVVDDRGWSGRSSTSGAPFTSRRTTRSPLSVTISWTVAMNLFAESNGTSASRGWRPAGRPRRCRPWRRAPTSAPSVGSPTSCHSPSSTTDLGVVAQRHRDDGGVDGDRVVARRRARWRRRARSRVPLTACGRSWATSSTAVISLSVSVPVLSLQMTLVHPSVSTDGEPLHDGVAAWPSPPPRGPTSRR